RRCAAAAGISGSYPACRPPGRLCVLVAPGAAPAAMPVHRHPSLRDVYSIHMARVNITVPDELLSRVKAAGLNGSRVAADALAEELDRRAKLAELDAYLAELDAEFGPITAEEQAAAREWADRVLPAAGPATDTVRRSRSA